MKSATVYASFIAITFVVGFTSGFLFSPDAWYAALEKPAFNPPNWLFPIAWSVLYILIGMAGGRIWIAGLLGVPFLLWIAQLGLNAIWSFLFFGMQLPGAALIEVVFLFAAIVGFIVTTWGPERTSALLFVPYAAWVGFAAVLNGFIWALNS